MKIFFLLLVLTMLNAYATSIFSQNATMSVDMQNVTVREVVSEIEKQGGISFLFNDNLQQLNRRVSVSFTDQPIKDVLVNALGQAGMMYEEIKDDFVVLLPKPDINRQQENTVTGRVTDAETGEGLPGVSIVIEGTTSGVTTDIKGYYEIVVPDEDAVLQFSFVGMRAQEIPVQGKDEINVTLDPDMIGIDEVVAIGYGTMKKSDLTGAVASAKISELQQMPNVSLGQSLQGLVPGLNVGAVNMAGEDPNISIRGATTISGNQNVLIVLDGIIFNGSLASLNPNDIASIDVLKDASSTAIYGAQAANGVLLISTKKGQAGAPKINFSSQISTQNPAYSLTPMNREEFLQKNRDLYWEQAYLPPDYTTPNPDFSFIPGALEDPIQWEGYENGTDFNWYEAGTQNGSLMEHQISISGQNDYVNYLFSGGFLTQNGYIKNDNFGRNTVRINLESNIKPWLLIGVQSHGALSDYSGEFPSMSQLLRQSPLTVPYDEEGNLIANPNQNVDLSPFIGSVSDDVKKRNSFFGNFYSEINFPFLEGLSYRINYGHNYRLNSNYNANIFGAGLTGSALKQETYYYDYTLDNILNYSRNIGTRHDLNITLLYGAIEREYSSTTAEARGFTRMPHGYHSLQQGNLQFTESGGWDESLLYQMGRINYKYDGKYLLTGTIRRDGFSGFSENNKYGYFPSMALGWIVSEESFLNLPWLDMFKVRVSYGANGNMTSRYSSLAIVNSNIAYIFGDGGSTEFGQAVSNIGNSDLKWEKTYGTNFGTDFVMFNGKLFGNIEYYSTTTNDLLFDVSLPNMTGFTEITTNLGEIQNRGIEFTLTPTLVQSSNVRWDVTLNFSRNVNEIKTLIGLDADGDGVEDDLVASNLFIGESIGAIYGYELDGFYQIGDERPAAYPIGSARIVDQTGDGISPDDRVILGREEPAYRFSIFNSVVFRNFTLRVLVNSIQGGKDGYLGANMPPSSILASQPNNPTRYNFFKELDFWTPSNPNAVYRQPFSPGGIDPTVYAERSFIRLQDVSLTYNFNRNFLDRLNISDLSLYLSGKNLAIWTNWEGWDPETGQGLDPTNAMPVLKSYSLGLNVTF